ncbi:hypothetical protein [Streptomyces sp. Wb2n-11]|uniref:hypothetical protein n=1 Tax=Streptomyces sp. Wb2n-11 TaxID=1030533 RepID=UPI000B85028E|nr:hypothetical protein [Streptomyces sp. Wb2n-11]
MTYGGLATTGTAEPHPERIDGSLSMRGLVQGGAAGRNSTSDTVFAFRTPPAPGPGIERTGFGDGAAARTAANTLAAKADDAQRTPGAAPAAALRDIPGRNDTSQPKPEPADREARRANRYTAAAGLRRTAAFAWRREVESRVGGDPSWNAGVGYSAVLRRSSVHKEVTELHREAGMPLRDDLAALNRAPRISAAPAVAARPSRTSVFTGKPAGARLNTPRTTGDALIPWATSPDAPNALARRTRTGDRTPPARSPTPRQRHARGRAGAPRPVFGYSGASGRETMSKSTNWPLLSGEGQFRRVALLSDVVVRSTCPRSGVGVSLCSA